MTREEERHFRQQCFVKKVQTLEVEKPGSGCDVVMVNLATIELANRLPDSK
jgi:hypothetical protein